MKTSQAQPQKLRLDPDKEAEIRRAMDHAAEQTRNAEELVQWAYKLKFVHRTLEPRIVGLGYYKGQLASVQISMNRREPTVSIASQPISLAEAMELFLELQTAERITWADNEYGDGYEKFLRAVANSLAAAQTPPQAIAA